MRFPGFPLAAAAFVLVMGSGWTAVPSMVKADTTLVDGLTLRTVTRVMTQYMLLAMRTAVDLTYEQASVDPHSGDLIISGMKLFPKIDWDQDRSCVVEIDRIASAKVAGFETVESQFELTGVTVAPSCFEPEQTAMMAAFGYNGVTVDTMSIDMSYEFGSSAADLTIHAAVRDAAAVTVTAEFDYVWISGLIPDADNPGGEPYPVGLLSAAEIAIENRGIFERLEPMLAGQFGDVAAVPQMITALLMDGLSEGGTRSPNAAETEFVNNVATEVGRFIAEKNRVVLSVSPPGGVWLTKNIFESPGTAIAALRPLVSAAPLVSRTLISQGDLMAAINGQGASLDTDAKLRVGGALLSGLGAPRSVAQGRALLQPLADNWHAGAALLLAEALAEDGEADQAYHLALRAAAGGEARAMTHADNLEEYLDPAFVLDAQAAATQGWPGAAERQAADQALISAADIGALRERAQAAALGKDGPRSYADAYYWASLAAAAGDRSSAGLRERLDRRFAKAEGAGREAWKAASQEAAAKAIETWTSGGLGGRIAALYGAEQ